MGKVEWFAGRLRELRDAAGLTQPALARRAGLSQAAISDLESGKREPMWGTVIALAGALGVPTDDFLRKPTAKPSSRGRGRPKKPKPPAPEAPKRPRGRPRKEK